MLNNEEFQIWLKTRPEIIQKLGKEFPIGSLILHEGEELFLVGYRENGGLLVSKYNPSIEYELAVEEKFPVCPSCVEKLELDGDRK